MSKLLENLVEGKTLASRFVLGKQQLAEAGMYLWQAHASDGAVFMLQIFPCEGSDAPALKSQADSYASLLHPVLKSPAEVGMESDFVWLSWEIDKPHEGVEKSVDSILSGGVRVAEALISMHAEGLTHGSVDHQSLISRRGGDWRLLYPRLHRNISAKADLLGLLDWLSYRFRNIETPEMVTRWQQLAAEKVQDEAWDARRCKQEIADLRLRLQRGEDDAVAIAASSDLEDGGAWPTQSAGEHRSRSWFMLPGLLLLAVVLGMGLLWWLPQQVQPLIEPPSPVPAVVVTEPVVADEAKAAVDERTPYDLELLLAQRKAAETVLDELIQLQLDLEDRQVDSWAPEQFQSARALATQGDEPFRAQQFSKATEFYTQALRQLQEIDALSDVVLSEVLSNGFAALDGKNVDAAHKAFDLALAINPESPMATRGKARAESLPAVLKLISEANAALAGGDLESALQAFTRAAEIDAQMSGLVSQRDQLAAQIEEQKFTAAMTRGLAALHANDWPSARHQLQLAARLRPESTAPKEALLELQLRAKRANVRSHGQSVANLVSAERWDDAIRKYQAALQEDPNLKFAQDGLKIAKRRAQLDKKLSAFVGEPEQWWHDTGRREASKLLQQARSVANPGPKLREQIAKLDRELELARQPQTVQLISDSSCNVVVYKVGRLGQFDTHQLSLRPGRYTVVASRDGYRDVRKEFWVRTDQPTQPIELRCQDSV